MENKHKAGFVNIIGNPNAGKSTLVNRLLFPDTSDTGDFLTLFYLEFDMARRQLHWVRAGHDPAILFDPHADRFSELTGDGMALGIEEEYEFAARSMPWTSFSQAASSGGRKDPLAVEWVPVGRGRLALWHRPSKKHLARLREEAGATHVVTVQSEKEDAKGMKR